MKTRWHLLPEYHCFYPVYEVPYTLSRSRSSGIRSGDEPGLKKTLANLPIPFHVKSD